MKLQKDIHFERVKEIYTQTKSSELTAKKIAEENNGTYSGNLSRTIRRWMNDVGLTKSNVVTPEDSEAFLAASKKTHNKTAKYYLITSAQNATHIHKKLWNNMLAYADKLQAEIEVIPIRYKNPTSTFQDLPNDWWDQSLHNYMIANRHNIHPNLVVVGDLKTQPTASTPLTGIEGLTQEASCIIGHPRQHFVTVPTLKDYNPKFLLSTGSITVENYTDSASGKKGEFHHTYGFVIVEIKDNKTFYLRQVSANKDGSFYDLDYKVSNGEVQQSSEYVETLVMGDLHIGHHCGYCLGETYGMIDRFNPRYVAIHDIMEGGSISHHEKKDPFIALQRELDGSWDMEKEIQDVIDFLKSFGDNDCKVIIVKSNHDIFIDRFLLDNDWRKEKNKYAYLKYALLKADGKLPNGILPYNIEQNFTKDKVICLTEDDTFKVKGVELAVHGHLGNASRGSASQFKRLNTKLITGHSHSPLRLDNLVTVGTLTKLRLDYNKGMSRWFNANAIVHQNGKTQLLLIFKDKGWTTL